MGLPTRLTQIDKHEAMPLRDLRRRSFRHEGRTVPAEQRAFIESLAPKDVWILGVALRGVPAMPRALDQAYRMLADHRVDVAEMTDDDSIFPFNYRDGEGNQILPFFSTEQGAPGRAAAPSQAQLGCLT
jgi:hypothetical protein